MGFLYSSVPLSFVEAAEGPRDKTKEGILWTEYENRTLKKRYLSDAKERHVQIGLDRHTRKTARLTRTHVLEKD